ncbi:MAG: hypothetical protein AAF682_14930 [Planctomycetota bacterium]
MLLTYALALLLPLVLSPQTADSAMPAAPERPLSAAMTGVADALLAGGGGCRGGSCPEVGAFVLAVVAADEPRAEASLLRARLEAQRVLGSYFGVRVQADTTTQRHTSTEVVGDDVTTRARRELAAESRAEVRRALVGLELFEIVPHGGSLQLVFGITAAGIERARALDALAREAWSGSAEGGPREVVATGAALVADGDLERARDRALEDAKRGAVEAARGTLVVVREYVAVEAAAGVSGSGGGAYHQAEGLIAGFEVLDERYDAESGFVWVRIQARVTPVDYRRFLADYFERFGAPLFHVDADPELRSALQRGLSGLGLRVTTVREDAEYLLEAEMMFDEHVDPISKTTAVTTLSCVLRLVDAASGEVPLTTAPVESRSARGSLDSRRDECRRLIAKRLGGELDAELTDHVRQLAERGRVIRVEIEGERANPTELAREVERTPGVLAVAARWEPSRLTLDVRTHLRAAELDLALRDALEALGSPVAESAGSERGRLRLRLR